MHPAWLAPATLAGIFAIRLYVINQVGLFNDEAYYWEWSRHLALSYFDHPPLVAWVIAGSTRLFGQTSFAVHFPALAFNILTSWILFRLVVELFPEKPSLAWASTLVVNCVPLFSLGAIFTTPDAPCVFFWVLTAYWTRLALRRPTFWYAAGLSSGLGLLSKYNFFLLPPALGLFLVTSQHRRWLRRKEPYIALAIMVALFAPVLIWNAQNHGASFGFHLFERHRRAFTPLLNLGRFFAANMIISPLLVVASVGGWLHSFKESRKGIEAHWYLVCTSSVILFFFSALAPFVLINPNWFGVGYATLLVSATDWLYQLRSKLFRAAAIGLAAAISALVYVQALYLPIPLQPKLNDFTADLHGWNELGQKLRELRDAMPRPNQTFVFSQRLQFSALAAFYGGADLQVTRLGGRRDAYDYWTDTGALSGKDAIFFSNDLFFEAPNDYPFQRCEPAGEWQHLKRGRKLRTFYFWRCFGYGLKRGGST